MELTASALLRLFVPEHGPDVEQFLERSLCLPALVEIGANHRGGALWSKSEASVLAIRERVHLLAHDVCSFAHTTSEQLRVFDDWEADLLVVVAPSGFDHDLFS